MLKIQRASAGSGKTYTLAFTFIKLFLTIRNSDCGTTRLRSGAEIIDSLQHILAVTFTNKATAEMKDRIVEKLAALATFDPSTYPHMHVDYLKQLIEDTGGSAADIVDAAQKALRALLFDYSAFNVSTIDSFFQTILRTFAYETDLNDSYQLELDSTLISTTGVDETLDRIISGKADKTTSAWLKLLMDECLRDGGRWNPFQRSASTSNGVYKNLLKNVEKMESEEFKIKRAQLDEFFSSNPDLYSSFINIEEEVLSTRKESFMQMEELAREIKETFESAGLNLKEHGAANLHSRIAISLSGFWNPSSASFKMSKPYNSPFNSKFKPGPEIPTGLLKDLVAQWSDAALAWLGSFSGPIEKLWKVYRKLLPYVPMLHVVGENIREYMEQTNSMQISETNTLLKRIIGNDDTPFIYERLGTRINHFLIDEFQDTSRLQWENFRPLLTESESRDCDNLIIGDAKQSIYRFRNADPSLITSVVPATFPGHTPAGYSRTENTNWRSCRRVVEFNNLFFKSLSTSLSDEFAELYSNVVQYPKHREEEGYVNISFYTEPGKGELPPHIAHAGELVQSILKRGYRQRDIAFLSRTVNVGNQIVEALMQYNQNLKEGDTKIEFISDQSLLVASARAVQILTSTLRTIAKGTNPTTRTGTEALHKGAADWKDISALFSFTSSRHPEMKPEEVVSTILSAPATDNAISDMLGSMQVVALPSLVEKIIEAFVPDDLKVSDTPYLAAFQDAVLDYCDNNPSDIGSFLEWWDRKADNLSITSPEDVDAVNIMTIHKSKGLEFDVVIIPVADMEFLPSPRKPEWGWVSPDHIIPHAEQLPPWIPVVVDSSLEDTPHQPLWETRKKLVAMDSLNMAYVAFTRAVRELYVFTPQTPKAESLRKFSYFADKILGNWDSEIVKVTERFPDETNDIPGNLPLCHIEPPEEEKDSEDNAAETTSIDREQIVKEHFGYECYIYGNLLDMEEVERTRKQSDRHTPVTISKYHVNSNRGVLRYIEPDIPAVDPEEEEDTDPRSEGNLMHDIMSRINSAADLDRAVLRLRLRGLLDEEKATEIAATLSEAIRDVESYGWFDSELRVINERTILQRGKRDLRPDRIMVDAEGNAIVVDYKFGSHEVKSRYHRQVKGYMEALLQTGRYRSVKGYLWYVRTGKVECVDQ